MGISFLCMRPFISFILIGIVFFYGLGDTGLFHNNEGLYGQIAQEMARGGSVIVPAVGGAPYIEKPPLLYWLTALCYRLFGVQEWSARLVPALSGVISIGLFYGAVRTFMGRSLAHVAALVMASSVGFLIFSRTLYFDGLFTALMTATLLSFFAWSQGRGVGWIRSSYGFLALSCLAKGFLALVLGFLTVLPFFIHFYKKDRRMFWGFFDPWGMSLFLGILIPWHVMACLKEPGFAYFYFINEHILRFLGLRQPKDYYGGSVFYYVHRLFLYLFPWSFALLVPTLKRKDWTWIRSFFSPSFWDRIRSFPGFCLWWGAVFFVFFSLSRAKANYYIMTILPPMACVMACWFHKLGQGAPFPVDVKKSVWGVLLAPPLTLILGAMALSLIPSYFLPVKWQGLVLVPPSLPVVIWGLAVLFFLVWRGVKNSLDVAQLMLFNVAMMVMVSVPILKQNEDALSSRNLITHFNHQISGAYTAVLYRDVEKMSSVLFYLANGGDGVRILLLDSLSNDLLYGCTVNRGRGMCISQGDLDSMTVPLFFFVYKEQWDHFEKAFPRARLWDGRGHVRIYEQT